MRTTSWIVEASRRFVLFCWTLGQRHDRLSLQTERLAAFQTTRSWSAFFLLLYDGDDRAEITRSVYRKSLQTLNENRLGGRSDGSRLIMKNAERPELAGELGKFLPYRPENREVLRRVTFLSKHSRELRRTVTESLFYSFPTTVSHLKVSEDTCMRIFRQSLVRVLRRPDIAGI